MCIEACPASTSSSDILVHQYSPADHHQNQFMSHLHNNDDSDSDAVSSGDGNASAARGRYGRRYEPPNPDRNPNPAVVVVKRPVATERTRSVTYERDGDVTTNGADNSRKQLSVHALTVVCTCTLNHIAALFLSCFNVASRKVYRLYMS